MRRLLFWLAIIAPLAVVALIVSSFILPLTGRRPWVTGPDIVWTIVILSAISAWITGIRMRRKIKKVLGREATDTDLASIKTWMQVDEQLRRQDGANPPLPSDSIVQVAGDPEIDETEFESALETRPFTAPASTGLLFHSYPAPGTEIVPMTFSAGWSGYVLMALPAGIGIWSVGPSNLRNTAWLPPVAIVYAVAVLVGAALLQGLKLEIRTDGILYTSMLRRSSFITFSEISAVMLLQDHSEYNRRLRWPWLNLFDLLITPKPETQKPVLKIPSFLFSVAAQEQIMRVLRPDVRSLPD